MNTFARKLRVLTPYMLAYGGGVRRVLGDGLPRLARTPNIEPHYAELCRYWADMDEMADAGVIINHAIGVPGSGVLSHRAGLGRAFDLLASTPRLGRMVWRLRQAAGQYDVIYVHGYRELVFASAALALLPRRRRPALVWHCHGIGADSSPPLLKRLAATCRTIITISDDVARRLKELGISRVNIVRIYNAVDASRIRRLAARPCRAMPRKAPGQRTILVATASLRAAKGIHLMVDVMRRLPAAFVLWIAGDLDDPAALPYRRQLERDIAAADMAERVAFLGRRDDIYAVMRSADLVVTPSLCREGFGLAAAEPMTLEIPVLVSNCGALPEVVDFGRCGLVFDPDQPESLPECIEKVFADADATRRRVAAAVDRVERSFAYSRWASEVADVLRGSCAGNGRRRRLDPRHEGALSPRMVQQHEISVP